MIRLYDFYFIDGDKNSLKILNVFLKYDYHDKSVTLTALEYTLVQLQTPN